jgi:hypothetical protein
MTIANDDREEAGAARPDAEPVPVRPDAEPVMVRPDGEAVAVRADAEPVATRADWASALLARLGVSSTQFLFLLLAEIALFNVVDLLLTRYVLRLGFATESNAVMGFFFRQGSLAAGVFKLGIVTTGVVLLWMLRRRRGVVLGAVLLTGVFAAVVAYQVAWIVQH